jgi:hypothetical protein
MKGDDYESSGSDDDMDGQYKGLSTIQLRALTRKKLIENKYDPSSLSEVQVPPSLQVNPLENEH